MITYSSNVNLAIDKLAKIERDYKLIALRNLKQFLLPIIQIQIKRFILDGGSNDLAMSWGYWQRTGGSWSYHKGKINSFSNGWTHATILPIHPMSYMVRKVNKRPTATGFALNDTKDLINSFTSVNDFTTANGANMYVGSTSFKLDYHEKFFKYKRKIIEPYSQIFAKNKALHQIFMNKVISEIERI